MKETVYMVVTADAFELPVLVTQNIKDIAKMFNTSTATIYCDINRQAIKKRKYKIIKVEIDED